MIADSYQMFDQDARLIDRPYPEDKENQVSREAWPEDQNGSGERLSTEERSRMTSVERKLIVQARNNIEDIKNQLQAMKQKSTGGSSRSSTVASQRKTAPFSNISEA